MPIRGGRVGGGSRGGGFRALRTSSSGGSRGFRINFGNQAPRAASSSVPNTNSSTSHPHHVHHRPWFRRGDSDSSGIVWRTIGIIVGLFVLGMCACVGLGLILQALGYGS